MPAERSKPMVVCTCHNPNRRGCSGTMQGIVMGAAQMLTHGFNNCTNLQDGNSVPAKRHGLPNRLQTSSYGARKVLITICNRKGIIKIVKQDCVEKRPNMTSSYFVPKFKCSSPERERQRLQCFSQPASLITYRRRQRSNVESIKTVQNELENLQMILLCKKGSHGVCVRGKQRSIPLPNRLESWTLKNHVQFICNSHTTSMCADPIGSGNMLTPSKTPENDWQLMRAQPKL